MSAEQLHPGPANTIKPIRINQSLATHPILGSALC